MSLEKCIPSGRRGRYRCSRRNYRSGERAGGEHSIEEELPEEIFEDEGMKVVVNNGVVDSRSKSNEELELPGDR